MRIICENYRFNIIFSLDVMAAVHNNPIGDMTSRTAFLECLARFLTLTTKLAPFFKNTR